MADGSSIEWTDATWNPLAMPGGESQPVAVAGEAAREGQHLHAEAAEEGPA